MKRKVFKNGPSLVITLPSAWVKEHSIKEGTEIDVHSQGNILNITTESEKTRESAVIDTKGIDRTFLRCLIRGAYKKGYDMIQVNYEKPTLTYHRLQKEVKIYDAVREEVESLIGFEIIESTAKMIIIKGFSEEYKEDFDNFLRKIFLNIIERGRELIKAPDRKEIFENWELEPWTIKKLINYCSRIINKKGHANAAVYHHILSSLDMILGIIHFTGRYVKEQKIIYSKTTKEIAEEIASMSVLYYEFFYNYSNDRIVKLSVKRYALREKILKSAEKMPLKEIIFLERFYETVEIYYRLIEARIDLEFV